MHQKGEGRISVLCVNNNWMRPMKQHKFEAYLNDAHFGCSYFAVLLFGKCMAQKIKKQLVYLIERFYVLNNK